MKSLLTTFCLIFFITTALTQTDHSFCDKQSIYWDLGPDYDIHWNVASENRLPHGGTFEMAGANIAAIVSYKVDQNKQLQLLRKFTFPGIISGSSKSASFSNEGQPEVAIDGVDISNGALALVKIDGNISFLHQPIQGISIQRTLFPSPSQRLFLEYWEIKNVGPVSRTLTFKQEAYCGEPQNENKNTFQVEVSSDVRPDITLHPNGLYRFALYYSVKVKGEAPAIKDAEFAFMERTAFLQEVGETAVLVSPEPAFNMAFELAKIKAAERSLSEKTNRSSILLQTNRVLSFPNWVNKQFFAYANALTLVDGLASKEVGTTSLALRELTCQSLQGNSGPFLGDSFYPSNMPQAALYCQLFTHGLFGISLTGEYGVIRCRPRMPSGWKEMELQELEVFGAKISLRLTKSRRYRGMYWFNVMKDGVVITRKRIQAGRSVKVYIPTP